MSPSTETVIAAPGPTVSTRPVSSRSVIGVPPLGSSRLAQMRPVSWSTAAIVLPCRATRSGRSKGVPDG
ncbi:MAG: hypothetical protein C0493_05675 [Kytococcus sp.]|nr:hypothetical protein [Kytococcus sp.]